ncbi:thiamine-phosphate synthase family protein [Neomoorella humiferrea]|uniref:Hydrogenase expression/formation protein HypE n=1 Tax=Neomoorella humiferrea TaxID=676965 RepID=A0A2T0AYX1_9FIRM|nr:thiamine-phosphate synthase family protein [Moorella humiferrea]PRR76209.1 Hydrogenase expression/formation protein HypE [Moorella humiferrea]
MIGKVNDDFFRKAILPHTGAKAPQLVIGPQMGVDAAVLKVGEDFLVIAEDPIFPGPTMSPDDFGWITVHIGASDVAVMGVKPQFMTYSLLLPPGTPENYIAELVKSISLYAAELGITVVGGHTGFYSAVNVPTIGGITVWGLGKGFVTPAGARVGDDVVITKGAAIEAAALIACELEEKLLAAGIDRKLVERAKKRLREMSVVAEAGIATAIGGVHAMHDATEGGLARGLWEVAEASGVGLKIERSLVPVPEDVRQVCAHFDLNPYEIISEGTLVLTCDPQKTAALLAALNEAGLEGAVIGKVLAREEGRYWVENDGRQVELVPPPVDRFWEVFFNALALKNDNRTAAELALCRELGEAVRELKAANIAPLIPEIGANLAYCLPEARDLKDVAAIPGRLLRFKGQVVALGEPEMGCSRHMGGTILLVREFFPAARSVINLRYSPSILEACNTLGLKVASMPVPEGYRQEDDDFYRDLRRTLAGLPELPDVIAIPDRLNLERLILILGKNPGEIVTKVKALAAKI